MQNPKFRVRAKRLLVAGLVILVSPLWAGPVDDLNPGEWYRAPSSKLSGVLPASIPSGNTGPAAIMSAWSGGSFDTTRNRLIVWGGGHADYAGNEVYSYDVDTLQWQRLSNPSIPVGGSSSSGVYGDGNPRSTHTYHHVAYAKNVDKFFTVGLGGVWQSGGRSNHSAGFDLSTNTWTSAASRPDIGVPEAGVTAYESSTGLIWHQPGWTGQLTSYDPTTDRWTIYEAATGNGVDLYASAAIDPVRRIMLVAGGGHFFVWDLNNPTSHSSPSASGPMDIVNGHAPGLAYDSESGKFVGWDGGTSVYTFDPDTRAWERISASSSNSVTPSSPASNGTYGRFQYVPSKNVFVLVNAINEDVYFYKLSSGSGTGGGGGDPLPPPSPPPAPPPPPPPPSGDVADFAELCGQPGVVRCGGFESSSDIDPYLLPAGGGEIRGVRDTSVAASGSSSLRFEIPSGTGANSSGSWLADLGADFGPGDTLHVMFRQRFSESMLNTNFGGGGWKQVIFHDDGASCASVELTTQNLFHRGFPQMYTDCGGRAFDVDIGGGDYLLQQGDYECHYQNQNETDCSYYHANEWMTFYYEFELGDWGTPTSHIRAYVAYAGGELKQFIDIRNFRLDYNDGPNDRYNRVQLTPYHTGKDSSLSHATAYTWYDDLIVSTQPIAATSSGEEVAAKPPSNMEAQ